MSGIVNSTGAVSGILGTTVGTPSAEAGKSAFMARYTSETWLTPSDGVLLAFNDDSTGDSFDTDSVFDTSTSKFTAPATGVYFFYYAIYTANSDADNAFGFENQSGEIANQSSTSNYSSANAADAADHIQTGTIVIPLSSGNTLWVATRSQSDVYTGNSSWGGVRLK